MVKKYNLIIRCEHAHKTLIKTGSHKQKHGQKIDKI